VSTAAVIPALNAARFLPALLAEIRALHPEMRLVIVDDGSSDGTGEAARASGAEVLVHPVNRGKGAALETGFRWALAEGVERVFTLDADGQHLPREMALFQEEMRRGRWDVVVGSRMADTRGMPLVRLLTNRFTSGVIGMLAGTEIPDSQSGFRLFRTACLAGLAIRSSRYDAESEILVRLARRGYRIGSVPITTVYGDEKSSINPLVDTGRFFRLVARLVHDR
jgi:glycosyltransferase involved in cell wall biosynthesis